MLAVTAIPRLGPRLDVQILRIFQYLDLAGGERRTAVAHLALLNNQNMTLSAGGSGVQSSPARPPFQAYEVILDHDPPRFWRRFTEDELLYAKVPKLLISHHIIRHGGLDSYQCLDEGSWLPEDPGSACPEWYI